MTELDLGALRAFTAAAEERQFSLAAAVLGISQQAVSKRIAKLETDLGVPLFDRVPAGIVPTRAGARLLPHARSLLALADDAVAAVRADPRPLRVAMLGERQATMRSVRYYLDRHPETDTEIVLSNAFNTSREALLSGRADAAFARAHGGPRPLPRRIHAVAAYVEPLHLLVGREHPLAGKSAVALDDLRDHPVWVPGASVPSEWRDFYERLAEAGGITIDTAARAERFTAVDTSRGPAPITALVDLIATSDHLATFSGDGFHNPWHPHLRRVPIVDPTPAYPHALLWDSTNGHPGLAHLVAHFAEHYNRDEAAECWVPDADRALFGVGT
ncbi:LysR family transcriptional regulator [Nocardia puris]|uniref:DNA-binding transcriptional LysR family regulator n=1 Tax=Nocardia puris TaxID=208602 RepID=A0A366E316_9NOCA|nr:LysR family transcriptional regulator [Nocardia puris]MBF6216280.1 LysR family transcriptional regulator [Nocardia puris]MBF6368927.1 LysR family transcriptional regulator [Nocardia puris]MBF6462925.1 LysR family transcriptional regulator [Nocardia puris]RBO96697.1 DNA-binding transcriptional LysR family regulator [Nocardia puris]